MIVPAIAARVARHASVAPVRRAGEGNPEENLGRAFMEALVGDGMIRSDQWVTVPTIRLERMTYRLQGGCSTN
jgi:hypothetical protein